MKESSLEYSTHEAESTHKYSDSMSSATAAATCAGAALSRHLTAEISHFLSNDRGCCGGLALKPFIASRTSTSSSEPRQVRSADMALPFPHAQAACAHAQRRVLLQSRCRYRVAGSFSTGQEVYCA